MTSKWGKTVGRKKTNNHTKSRAVKIDIRQRVMALLPEPRVFDAFAGSGRMHRDVWHQASHYVGCDLKWYPDSRVAYVADNRRVMRAIDLADFNLFDFDAYGNPWEQCLILAARRAVRPGENIGIVLTDGSSLKLKLGGMPAALKKIAGLRADVAGASRLQDSLFERAIINLAKALKCSILQRWEAQGKTGAAVIYSGLVLQGLPKC